MRGEVRLENGKRVATPEYRSWQMMKNRCLNPKAVDYKYYGGRGITVCKRWMNYENFLEDMGRRISSKHTLERLNSDKNYTPSNCVWAPRLAQSRNRAYAKTKSWELAQKLGVSTASAAHYIWMVRAKDRGVLNAQTAMSDAREHAVRTFMQSRGL